MESLQRRPDPVSPPLVATLVTVVVVGIAGVSWYLWPQPEAPARSPATATRIDTPTTTPKAPPAHYPVPALSGTPVSSEPLPALDASDAAIAGSLANLLGLQNFGRFFRPEALVRHVVATIDNLPRRTYAQRLSPVNPVGGLLVTTGRDEGLVLAPENAARYTPWVKLLEQVDVRRVVAIYVHFYPLFQQAYAELGYPDGYFNNRLVQVIDHLLATPAVQEPLRLVVRHVLPEFADPALESESSGRKILMRMGPANASIVKAKLVAIRRELTERTPGN